MAPLGEFQLEMGLTLTHVAAGEAQTVSDIELLITLAGIGCQFTVCLGTGFNWNL